MFSASRHTPVTQEPRWLRYTLITVAIVYLALFLLVPLISIFYEALRQGVAVYWAAMTEPDSEPMPPM